MGQINSLEEEIQDLEMLLSAIPEALKEQGAFESYEKRLGELKELRCKKMSVEEL